MTPHLTDAGRTLLLAACTLIIVGTVATNWPMLLLGEVLAVLLAVQYFLSVAKLVAIEEGFVAIAVTQVSTGEAVRGVAGRPSTLTLEVLNLSSVPFARLALLPEHSDGLRFEPERLVLTQLAGGERVQFSVQVEAGAAGRYVLHGFRLEAEGGAGLVAVSDYLPTPVPLKFLPAVVSASRSVPISVQRQLRNQELGMHTQPQRGLGSDFRELRDHVVGDPFRAISWKATARTGRLMVRQFEDEVVADAFVVLDISSTMRGGRPPHTKLAHGIDLTAELVTMLAASRDRVGLITYDEVVYGHIRQASAGKNRQDIVDHLVGLSSIVAPELTELDDDEVTGALVRYLMVQERLDFRRQDRRQRQGRGRGRGRRRDGEGVDRELLDYWVRRRLPREAERMGDRCLSVGTLERGDLSDVRRFCQLRGIAVPYRLEARFGAKEQGMVAALERFMEGTRESHLVIVVSDLCGIVQTKEIVAALRLVQAHKHRPVLFMPYTPDYVSETSPLLGLEDEYDRAAALLEVFRLAERRERARIANAIAAAGVPVLPTRPGDRLDTLLRAVPRAAARERARA
jgi:uncharacterized protein (DUF58 family)